MIMKHPLRIALLVIAGACASPKGEVFGQLQSDTLRLVNGDSVELQARLPAVVPGSSPGRMYMYYPFCDLADSVRLRRIAVGVFMQVRSELEKAPPAFVVLRAVNLPTAQRKGRYNIENYGFVIEHRGDGHWYFLDESQAVR